MQKSIILDFTNTLFTQILITIFGIAILKIFAHLLNEDSFGIYLIIKRFVSFLGPLLTLNLGMSLARYISLEPKKADNYFVNSLILILSIFVSTILVFTLFPGIISKYVFGGSVETNLNIPIILFLFATTFHILCGGYFRGKRKFSKMNLLDLIFWLLAFISLSVYFFKKNNQIDLIHFYFILFSSTSILINIFLVWTDKNDGQSFKHSGFSIKGDNLRFLLYGIKRIPQGFFMSGIFFIPVLIASNFLSLKQAAYIGIIIAFMNVLQIFMYPFNLILLPKFSFLKSKGENMLIKKHAQNIVDFSFTFPLLIGICVSFLANEIILVWFGPKYQIVGGLLQIIGPFLSFFLVFVLIRGLLDGLYDYPYTNFISFLSFSFVLIASGVSIIFDWSIIGLSSALVGGLIILGIGIMIVLIRAQNLVFVNKNNIKALVWYICVILVIVLMQMNIELDLIFSLVVKLLIVLIIFALSFVVYRKIGFNWVEEFVSRFHYMIK